MSFTVELDSRGNPDHGQDPERPVWGVVSRKVFVKSLEEASKVCTDWIRANDLGGGNWVGGTVRDSDGAVVGRVSYNGRFWPASPDQHGH